MDRDPHTLTEAEWQEIVDLPAVREAWGLRDDHDRFEFARTVYGARFNFISGNRDYVGDLYILQGDTPTEIAPMVLRQDKDGHLIPC